jgi:hypothetical protein
MMKPYSANGSMGFGSLHCIPAFARSMAAIHLTQHGEISPRLTLLLIAFTLTLSSKNIEDDPARSVVAQISEAVHVLRTRCGLQCAFGPHAPGATRVLETYVQASHRSSLLYIHS